MFLIPETCNFIKKDPLALVFSYEFCEIFKNIFFYRTPPEAASDIFGGSHLQIFFKIGALIKNFAILRIKKGLQHRYFPVRSSHTILTNDRFSSQNAGIVILCHRSEFIFEELVYPSALFCMFCKNKHFQLDQTKLEQLSVIKT